MLGDRVVVALVLRPRVLHLLHAAHQGIDRMKARAADVVYWHGIVAAQRPATPQPAPSPVQRPKRIRIPNVRLSPGEWELGQIGDGAQTSSIMDLLL